MQIAADLFAARDACKIRLSSPTAFTRLRAYFIPQVSQLAVKTVLNDGTYREQSV